MKNRVVIYSIGKTFHLYLNVSDDEADRRFQQLLGEKTPLEIEYEKRHGLEPKRDVVEFDDELTIWGDAGEQINEITSVLFKKMSDA